MVFFFFGLFTEEDSRGKVKRKTPSPYRAGKSSILVAFVGSGVSEGRVDRVCWNFW